MIPILQQKFDQLLNEQQRFLQIIESTPVERLSYKPTPDAWSMLQVAHHACLVESSVVRFLNKYPPIPVSWFKRLKIWGRSTALKLSLWLPIKFKAPRVAAAAVEEQSIPMEQLLPLWNSSNEQLRQYLAAFDQRHLHYAVFKHPFAGALTITQTLDFMAEHLHHHLPQLNRLRG